MKWFKLYSEARIDAKLKTLTDSQFRIWFNLLCLAAEQKTERGTISTTDSELLAIEVSGGDVNQLTDTISRLIKLQIISRNKAGKITFIHFVERQYENPSDRPEAVRERKRKQRDKSSKMSRDVTSCHDTDKDLDQDKDPDQKQDPSPPVSPPEGEAVEDKTELTIDEVFNRHPRYSNEQLTIIRDYWETIRFTRQTGIVAPSIVAKEMAYWERFQTETVMRALNIHLTKYRNDQGKREDYTRGIIRRVEREVKGNGGTGGDRVNPQIGNGPKSKIVLYAN